MGLCSLKSLMEALLPQMSYALAVNVALDPPLDAFRGSGHRDEVASGPLAPHVHSIWGAMTRCVAQYSRDTSVVYLLEGSPL